MLSDQDGGRKKASADSSTSLANRRLRNRLSQKASREKQTLYIKELERRLESSSKSESEKIRELQDKNKALQYRLFECHKKLESLRASMKALSDSVAGALHIEGDDSFDSEENEAKRSPSPPTQCPAAQTPEVDNTLSQFSALLDFPAIDMNPYESSSQSDEISSPNADAIQIPSISGPTFTEYGTESTYSLPQLTSYNNVAKPSTPKPSAPQIPLSPSSLLHMGPTAYESILSHALENADKPGVQVALTNSIFSDHIMAVEYCLRKNFVDSRALLHRSGKSLARSTHFMLSTFVSMAWPEMTAWHAYTKSHIHIAKISNWRLTPNPTTYANLSACYRPTHMQLTVPHPAVIDWIPFPALRDKLILYHSANPHLDNLISEIGNSYVAEGDLSKLIKGLPPTMGYVGAWDLVKAMSSDDPPAISDVEGSTLSSMNGLQSPLEGTTGWETFEEPDQSCGFIDEFPARSVDTLFESKECARKAFELLGMDNGCVTFRLTPSFFEAHPELYDAKANEIAHGIHLRPAEEKLVTTPKILNSGSLAQYQAMSMWTFDLTNEPAFQDIIARASKNP